MPDLPISPREPEPSKRRTLLRYGHDRGWWTYESENQPGYTDRNGHTYAGVTYTLRLPDLDDAERVLLADEVYGYVLATADQYGKAAAIAYRPGLPTGGPPENGAT